MIPSFYSVIVQQTLLHYQLPITYKSTILQKHNFRNNYYFFVIIN